MAMSLATQLAGLAFACLVAGLFIVVGIIIYWTRKVNKIGKRLEVDSEEVRQLKIEVEKQKREVTNGKEKRIRLENRRSDKREPEVKTRK